MFKNCQKTSALPILTRISINSVQSFKVTFLYRDHILCDIKKYNGDLL